MAVPSDLSGLTLHLKADSLSLNDGDSVSTWADQSGNSNDATQATASNQPKYKTGIINGEPAVLSDGSNDFLDLPSLGISGSDNRHVFIVGRYQTLTLNENRLFQFNDSGSTGTRWTVRLNGGNLRIELAGSGYTSGLSVAADMPFIAACALDGTTLGGHVLRLNGDEESASGTNTVNTTDSANTIFDSNQPYDGYIAEIILYNRALSASEVTQIEDYLNRKYHISAAVLDASASGVGTAGADVFAGHEIAGTATGVGTSSAALDAFKALAGSAVGVGNARLLNSVLKSSGVSLAPPPIPAAQYDHRSENQFRSLMQQNLERMAARIEELEQELAE